MNATIFIDYVTKWFGPLVAKVTETVNGEKTPPKYLHETMLTPEYSADLRWDSSSINGSIVAADIVAMDSPLPLKRRDSLAKASGDLPKLGIKLKKGEKLISDINVMRARGASDLQIVQKLFDDMPGKHGESGPYRTDKSVPVKTVESVPLKTVESDPL